MKTKECGVQKAYKESITDCNYALIDISPTENEYAHHGGYLLIIFHVCF